MNAKGQSTIEAALALPVIVALALTMATISYRASVYFWADHNLHEAIICLDSISAKVCEEDFKRRIRPALLFKEDSKIKLQKHRAYFTGEVLLNLKPPITIKQKRYEKK